MIDQVGARTSAASTSSSTASPSARRSRTRRSTRAARRYLTALSISAYSLTALLRAAQPLMENRPGGAGVVGLTYLGGDRVVPHYGGGMSTAKAALQIDAKQLAQQPRPQEHPRQPDLGRAVRVAGRQRPSATSSR